jgi:hypothetical protein
MRPKKPETTRSGDLFRARLDQIINLKHKLAQLAGQIDWDFIDGEIAPLYSDKGRVIGVYGMTAVGTKRSWRRSHRMSAVRGEAEDIHSG